MGNFFGSNIFSLKKKKILIIDDSVLDRRVIEHVVSEQYPILLARDGREGIALAKERMPDLIVLDYLMPDLTGAAVCKILKEEEKTKHIPIIILTTYDTPEISAESFEHGANAFMSKPVDRKALLKKIASLL